LGLLLMVVVAAVTLVGAWLEGKADLHV
jgi:hypothetical protein